MTERDIQTSILRTFATRDDMRLWRASTGVAVPLAAVRAAATALRRGNIQAALRMLDQAPALHFGVNGQADLSGIIGGDNPNRGRRLEIEVKKPDGRQSEEQRNYQQMIERFGGLYVLARSTDDVQRALTQGDSQ